jgi:hypothetical protein
MTTPAPLSSRTSYGYWAFSMVALLAVTAATAQIAIDASGNYKAEMQSCRSGQTPQNLATCQEEARNAQADKKHSKTTPKADLEANAMTRCDPLPIDDKAACRARMMGQGSSSGSVAGGGILRTFTSVETLKAAP